MCTHHLSPPSYLIFPSLGRTLKWSWLRPRARWSSACRFNYEGVQFFHLRPAQLGQSKTPCYTPEPQWSEWTATTGCIKIHEDLCVHIRTRTCLNNEMTNKNCSGSHLDTLPCKCLEGEKALCCSCINWLIASCLLMLNILGTIGSKMLSNTFPDRT